MSSRYGTAEQEFLFKTLMSYGLTETMIDDENIGWEFFMLPEITLKAEIYRAFYQYRVYEFMEELVNLQRKFIHALQEGRLEDSYYLEIQCNAVESNLKENQKFYDRLRAKFDSQ
jgi:hypothetical protein